MKPFILVLSVILCFLGCEKQKKQGKIVSQNIRPLKTLDSVTFSKNFIAHTFDYPVGRPNTNGYYNAQKFQENSHLGEDWNAVTGGNSDLGDPIYAIANGYIKFATNEKGGWGNVIRILHKLPNGKFIESLYAHCDTILVKENEWVKKGDKIGTIGTANGLYLAHLHFEIRDDVNLPIGPGYSNNTEGYLHPTNFIKAHR